MRSLLHASKRPLRIAVLSIALAAGVIVPTVAEISVAQADDDAPIAAGVKLVARTDVEIQKVVIARATKIEVMAAAGSTVDVALPDGYVLHKIPVHRIRYFFDVVR